MLSPSNLIAGQDVFVRCRVSGAENKYQFHSYERSRYRGDSPRVWLFDLEHVGLDGPSDNGLSYLTLSEFKKYGRVS